MKLVLKVIAITLLFAFVADRVLGWVSYKYNYQPFAVGGTSDTRLTESYMSRIDKNKLNEIPDIYANIRYLEGQRLEKDDEFVGKMAMPNCQDSTLRLSAKAQPSNTKLYEVVSHYDAQCRRVTPPSAEPPRHFLMAIGCSLTFGHGVEDNQTLPYFLSQNFKDVAVYNYGQPGASPASWVRNFTKEPARLQKIDGSDGVAIWYMADFHMMRIVCPASCLKENRIFLQNPYFELDRKGVLHDLGSFGGARWFKNTMLWFAGNSVVRQAWKLEFPSYTSHDFDLMIALLSDLRFRIGAKVALKKFIVVFSPGMSSKITDRLAPLLREHGFGIIDYSRIGFYDATDSFAIPVDRHTSPRGNYLLAKWLAEDLKPFLEP